MFEVYFTLDFSGRPPCTPNTQDYESTVRPEAVAAALKSDADSLKGSGQVLGTEMLEPIHGHKFLRWPWDEGTDKGQAILDYGWLAIARNVICIGNSLTSHRYLTKCPAKSRMALMALCFSNVPLILRR